jgi:sugar lactone lactonase YvrE
MRKFLLLLPLLAVAPSVTLGVRCGGGSYPDTRSAPLLHADALDDQRLYFGAIGSGGLYRLVLAKLRDAEQPDSRLSARVERYATQPLSDGMTVDLGSNVFGTDIEPGAVFVVYPGEQARTLLRSDRLRWPDALAFGPEGWLYVTDGDLADVVLKPREHIESHRPYRMFRSRPFADDSRGR